MTVQTEGAYTGEFLLGEDAAQFYHRDTVTIISGQNLVAGQVLGKITASGKYTAHDTAHSDGSQSAAAILYGAVDASGGDTPGVIVDRDVEVNGNLLVWKSGISGGDKTAGIAALAALGIIVR